MGGATGGNEERVPSIKDEEDIGDERGKKKNRNKRGTLSLSFPTRHAHTHAGINKRARTQHTANLYYYYY